MKTYTLAIWAAAVTAAGLDGHRRVTGDASVRSHFAPKPPSPRVAPTSAIPVTSESKPHLALHLDLRRGMEPSRASSQEPDPSTSKPGPVVRVASSVAWIKEFWAHQAKHPRSPTATATATAAVRQHRPLGSSIKTYERLQSDPTQLQEWTRYVVQQSKLEDASDPGPLLTANSKLDIPEFVRYLTQLQGFHIEDLDFLQAADLDYGFDEIEQELTKIRHRQNNGNKIIDIGGENDARSRGSRTAISITLLCVALALDIGSYSSVL